MMGDIVIDILKIISLVILVFLFFAISFAVGYGVGEMYPIWKVEPIEAKVTWINEGSEVSEWRWVFGLQDGRTYEIGFRNDGIVVWRKEK